MTPWLEDEDDNKPKDYEQEKENALPPASVFLIPVGRGSEQRKDGEIKC